jgi:hypothetical protein
VEGDHVGYEKLWWPILKDKIMAVKLLNSSATTGFSNGVSAHWVYFSILSAVKGKPQENITDVNAKLSLLRPGEEPKSPLC